MVHRYWYETKIHPKWLLKWCLNAYNTLICCIYKTSCWLLVVARQMPSRALSGHPVILVCSQRPAAPVNWSFRHLPDSEPQHIVTEGLVVSERFDIDGSSLIIRKVQPSDGGSYSCCDANRDVFTYNVTVAGEEITVSFRNMKFQQRSFHHNCTIST